MGLIVLIIRTRRCRCWLRPWHFCCWKLNRRPLLPRQSTVGGEQRRNQEFRFRFRQCRYRNFWQEKTGKFVNLWIDFREDIFPVYFYSESESYSLKSIQRITNSLAFSCQKFRYRHCRNRNRNSWFLLCSPPIRNALSLYFKVVLIFLSQGRTKVYIK